MSTEYYDAKAIADDIHEIAKVPERLNEHIYNMTLDMIGRMIVMMDKLQLPMGEQRRRMGAKKDELIRELISLRERGILRSGEEGQKMAKPIAVRAEQIRVRR